MSTQKARFLTRNNSFISTQHKTNIRKFSVFSIRHKWTNKVVMKNICCLTIESRDEANGRCCQMREICFFLFCKSQTKRQQIIKCSGRVCLFVWCEWHVVLGSKPRSGRLGLYSHILWSIRGETPLSWDLLQNVKPRSWDHHSGIQ